MYYNNYELYHFGIAGMHWGKRNGPPYPLGSSQVSASEKKAGWKPSRSEKREQRRIDKTAKKDAKRYMDAKMYYGEGAGNRRKLLKGELDKKFKDPRYKKAFDSYVNEVDVSRSVNKAKLERNTRDTMKKAKKVARTAGGVALFAGGIYYAANKEKVDRKIVDVMNTTYNKAVNMKRVYDTKDFLRRAGFRG